MDREAIGKRIRERREELGYSLSVLAKLINVGKSHLSEIERGHKGLSVETLMLIVKYLKTTYNKVLHGK